MRIKRIMSPSTGEIHSQLTAILGMGAFVTVVLIAPRLMYVWFGLFVLIIIHVAVNHKDFEINWLRQRVLRSAEVKFRRFVGSPIDIDVGVCAVKNAGLVGTGIAYSNGTIYVLEAGVAAAIPSSEVRGFRYVAASKRPETAADTDKSDGREKVEQTSPPPALTPKQVEDVLSKMGFFVQTSDPKNPEWRFFTIDPDLCTKWEALLSKLLKYENLASQTEASPELTDAHA